MKLISSELSPFARKVRVLLHETGLAEQVEVVSNLTTPLNPHPEAAAANPTAKVPTLLLDSGKPVYDSRVITRYLDHLGSAGLYPADHIWDVLTLEATADAIMESAVAISYEKRLRPPELQSEDWIEAQWKKVAGAVAAVNNSWMKHLAGPMDMGHIAMGCALAYLDFRHDERAWRKGNDALDDWFAVFAERDSMKSTAPE